MAKPLKPWMGYYGEKSEGAALVFARSHKEARVVTWRTFYGIGDCEYIGARAQQLTVDPERFMAHCTLDEPHGILEIPKDLHCDNCQFWGMPLDADRLCKTCAEDKREWDAWMAGESLDQIIAKTCD